MTDFLLLENGSYLLQENGSKIILIFTAPIVTAPIKRANAFWDFERKKYPQPQQKEKIYLNEIVKSLR